MIIFMMFTIHQGDRVTDYLMHMILHEFCSQSTNLLTEHFVGLCSDGIYAYPTGYYEYYK
jgi:hypothetical protein